MLQQNACKMGGAIFNPTSYEDSLEAQNRDSTKNVAEVFNRQKGQQEQKGKFIFLSAEPSILPLPSLVRYVEMKREAEVYLQHSCPNLDVVIIRPGLVTDAESRPMTVALGFFADIASSIADRGMPWNTQLAKVLATPPPSTSLSYLVKIIEAETIAQSQGTERDYRIIGAKQLKF